ncbi:MAG: glycosyltransferase family 4 protein [Planctomycetia bacterium]|nr:glycosyltransferase family 4 protein [Planctomycetia bacterium]
MTRILICSTEFPPGPGGIGTHAWQLARHLTRLDWTVRVVTCQDYVSDAEIDDWNSAQPFEVIRLPSGQRFVQALWSRTDILRRQLAEFSPDLIVASGLKSLWLVAAQMGLDIPWVAIGHGSEFNLPRGWKRWLTRRALSSTQRVVCVSEFTRELALQLGVARDATEVILNGADDEAYFVTPPAEGDACRRQLGADVEQLLLTVGHVSLRKAQDLVIRAMPRVLTQFPNAHYGLAGIPTLRPQLQELAKSLGVEEHVYFLGRLSAAQLRAWFNACDVFVLTSRNTASGDCEGFGIVAIEAALCGKPAVVSRGSGLAEAVVDGETGFTVPQEDPDATADAIIRLLADRELRNAAGKAALDRARREFTWSSRVAQYDRLFRDVAPVSREVHNRSPIDQQAVNK